MLSIHRFSLVGLFLFAVISLPVLSAEQFSGYVVESLNGLSSETTAYQYSLIGLATSPTGPVVMYRTAIDPTYSVILANARLHRQFVSVSYVGGGITGVYIKGQ